MKRMVLTLIVLFTAASLFAGGKECKINKSASRNVELTGTLVSGAEHAVFRVANSDKTYTVCEKTKNAVLQLGNEGKDTLRVKGKVVSCGEGEELLIESATKI
jgi:hypothetical protein